MHYHRLQPSCKVRFNTVENFGNEINNVTKIVAEELCQNRNKMATLAMAQTTVSSYIFPLNLIFFNIIDIYLVFSQKIKH